MSQKLPRVTPDEIMRILEKIGFVLTRQSGSHKIFRNAAGKRVTVPYHKGRVLHPKVLTSIMKDAELTREDLQKLLRE